MRIVTTKSQSSSKKVLIDARLYGLENAGLGRYTINLLSNLSKIDKSNEYIILLRKKYFHGLNFPDNFKKVLADFRHYSLTEQIALPRIISKQNPDLVHFLHMNVPLFYTKIFIVTVHDLLMQKHRGSAATTLPFYSYFSKLMAAKYVFKNAILKSSQIIAPSEAVKSEIVQYYKVSPSKIKRIYEGTTDFNRPKETNKTISKYRIQKPYLIYSGNAYPHKNLDRAIQSIKLLNLEGTKINFYITCSRNVFTDKLEKKIAQSRAYNFVKYLGFVPDDDLKSLLSESLGFLYPSLSEGFGLQGLEAMKSQTLVICSDIPVFREIYKNVPIYFDPFNPKEIAEAMKRAMSLNIRSRQARISEGIKLSEKYSWEKMAKETLEIYNEVLQQSSENAKRRV